MLSLSLTLSLFLTGLLCVRAEIVLTQSGSEIRKPGENARILCSVSGFNPNDYWMHWVRQAPGKGLEWVARYHSTSSPPHYISDAVKGRFTASTEGSTFHLQMNSLKTEDSGIYSCAREYYGSYFDYWGSGTFVTVTSDKTSPPKVFPLVSCCGLETATNVAIGCLVKDFLPESAKIIWQAGSQTPTGIITTPPIQIAHSKLYSMTSYLSVNKADWESTTYKCTVKHQSLNSDETRDLSSAVCKSSQPLDPTVHLMLPSCDVAPSFDLTCLLSNYRPNNLKVKWLVKGEEKSSQDSKLEALKGSDGTFMAKSLLHVKKEDWDKGTEYTCHVARQEVGRWHYDKMYNISKCSACFTGLSAPTVHLIRPSYQDIPTDTASVTCLVVGHDLQGTKIIWEIDGKVTTPILEDIVSHTNKSQSRWSRFHVSFSDWKTQKRYSCKAVHPCFEESEQEFTVRDSTYEPRTPSVILITPDGKDLFKAESFTFFCDVAGFYPQDISIVWKNNKTLVDKTRYTNGPITGSAPMYSTYSLLRVGKNEGGGAYSCEVYHETLDAPKAEIIQDVFGRSSTEGSPYNFHDQGDFDLNELDETGSVWTTASTFIALFLLTLLYSSFVTFVKVK